MLPPRLPPTLTSSSSTRIFARDSCRYSTIPFGYCGRNYHSEPSRRLVLLCEPLGLTVTDAAEALGVSRKTLSTILNGRAGVSPEMAIRLSKAFDTSAESWLNQQVQYDLSIAEQSSDDTHVKKLSAA